MTAKSYSSDLRIFKKNLSELPTNPSEYDEEARKYLNSRRNEAPSSTARRIISLREFGRFFYGERLLEDYRPPNPGASQPHPLAEGMAGIEKLLSVCINDDQTALIVLQGYFALRVSEARSAIANHFDTDRRVLMVRGKGDKVRHVPYSEKTFNLLKPIYLRSKKDGEPLVRLTDSGARTAIRRCAYLACLAGEVSSHDLRATCLTALYDKTKDIRLVQEFAGHASIEHTRIYIKTDRDAMRKAVEF